MVQLRNARNSCSATFCELTDVYRPRGGFANPSDGKPGHKCQLVEAYRGIFGRSLVAHDAGDDAVMTMELYKHWVLANRPARVPIDLRFFVVNAHSFRPAELRAMYLWNFLRPMRAERDVVIENDSGENRYQLKFRREEEREAYLAHVRAQIDASGDPAAVAFGTLERNDDGSRFVSCRAFKLHLYEQDR